MTFPTLLRHDPWIPVNAQETSSPPGEHGQFVRLSYIVEQAGEAAAKENPEVARLLRVA